MRQRAAFFDAAEIDHWLHSDFLQYMSSFFWLILVIPKCKNRMLDANESRCLLYLAQAPGKIIESSGISYPIKEGFLSRSKKGRACTQRLQSGGKKHRLIDLENAECRWGHGSPHYNTRATRQRRKLFVGFWMLDAGC
ncbi:hypothetical protein KC316_g79 [Hortaea werneckii]|nr:hypothetical protein KC316_g79 [Hortaea werneckii]